MSNTLTSLKDIPGVFGSFVFAPDGSLAARDMPAVYPDEIFHEISRRLQGIAEAVEFSVTGFYELLAKYDGHWLLTRMTEKGTLNVLADESVNFPALKMATNVAVKHLDQITRTPIAPTPPPVPMPLSISSAPEPMAQVPPLSVVPTPVPPERPRRIWRGQVVD